MLRFDSQNRTCYCAAPNSDYNARPLQLAQYARESATIVAVGCSRNSKRNLRHTCRRRRGRVVTDSANASLAEIEHNHRFKHIVHLRLLERQTDLRVIADHAATLEVSDAVAVENDA